MVRFPFESVRDTSKAVAAMLLRNLRPELEVFGVKIDDFGTGSVPSNFHYRCVQTRPSVSTLHMHYTRKYIELGWSDKRPLPKVHVPSRSRGHRAEYAGPSVLDANSPTAEWAGQLVAEIMREHPSGQVLSGQSAYVGSRLNCHKAPWARS